MKKNVNLLMIYLNVLINVEHNAKLMNELVFDNVLKNFKKIKLNNIS